MNVFRAISNILRFDRTNWKALALCVFAASIFWIFNALNKDYSTNLRFPLLFEFDDSKYIPVEPLPPVIILNVSGNGWDLFRKSLGVKVPSIALTLERPVETRKIVASALSPVVASQIGSLQVNYIVSDTLRLKIEPKVSRKLKLTADLSGVTYKQDFGQTGPVVIIPDSISLEGPKSIIETMGDTLTVSISGSRINSSFRESVEVILPHGDLIKRNPPVAEIMFDVGVMESLEHWVKLKTPKMPWGIEVDRDTVRCVFLFPQKEHDRFIKDIENAIAVVQMIELKKGESKFLAPNIEGIPDYSRLVMTDSVRMKKY